MSHIMNFFGRRTPAASSPVKPFSMPTRSTATAPPARPQLVPVGAAPSTDPEEDTNVPGVVRLPAPLAWPSYGHRGAEHVQATHCPEPWLRGRGAAGYS